MKLSNTDEQRNASAQGACKEVGAAVDAAYATGQPLCVALTQKDLVRAIRAAAERLQRFDKDALPRAIAQREVRSDLSIMRMLSDRDARLSAAASMAGTVDQQLAYKFELEVQSLELAREVEAAARPRARRACGTGAGRGWQPFDIDAEPNRDDGATQTRESVPVAITMSAGRNRIASNEAGAPARPDA
jgi:hypothetical protein